ncbi:MAG TPA: SPFH domain-containing protein [Pirellulaceae bacterium]
MQSDERRFGGRNMQMVSAIALAVTALLLLMIFAGGFDTVPAGHRGVRTRFGRVVGKSLLSGLQVKLPLVEKITPVETREKKLELKTSASSKDLQTVQSTIAVNYHPADEEVHELFEDIGPDFEDRILKPVVEETVKAVTAQFTAEELITKRSDVSSKMKSTLAERVQGNHLAITKFNIVDFEFSHSFNEAIEAKQTAEQEALKALNELKKIKVEADQKIEEARGRAESVKLEAKAEADAIRFRAEAEAKAQEMLSQVVNRDVIMLRAIEKWDGIMPRVAGEAVPFFTLGMDPEDPRDARTLTTSSQD